jgi:hypothetical protein
LEYAVLVRLGDGSSASFPLYDPLAAPQIVSVTAPQEVSGLKFQVLYPQAGETVYESEVRIAVSVFDPDSSYNPATLTVQVDGRVVAVDRLTASFIFVKLTNLKSGRHNVRLKSRNYTGEDNPAFSWSFRTQGYEASQSAREFAWGFTGEAGSENFTPQTHDYLRGDLRAEARLGSWNFGARGYLTSDESPLHQPQDRFLLRVSQRHLVMNLGDATPMFNDLVLNGKRVRGAEIGLHAGAFHLQGAYGEVTRGVEGSVYRRMLGSVRPYITTSWGGRFGLTLLKAKDDVGSISQSLTNPQDNVVAGLEVLVPLFQNKLQWSWSAALSLTALDTRAGSLSDSLLEEAGIDLPFSPKSWENFLVINESLSPPNPLGMSSLAWTTTLNLNHFGQMFSLNYRNIGPAYRSLGNPYLQNDLAGWNLSDQFSLWSHRLFITLGVNSLRDNLENTKSSTTTNTGGWISFSLYPKSPAPQITATFSYTHGANNLTGIDTLATNNDTLFTDERRDEASGAVALSATQEVNLLGYRNFATFSLNSSQYLDRLEDRPPGYIQTNSVSRNFNFVWRTNLSPGFTSSLDISHFSSESGASLRYTQIGGQMNRKFPKISLNVAAGLHRRSGEGNLARWQGDLSGEWEFQPRHLFRLVLTHYRNDHAPDQGMYRLYYFRRF